MCSQKCARPDIFTGSDKEPVKLTKTFFMSFNVGGKV